MANTKLKILMTALRLFAVYGYEAVSVSQIAGELGMTKGRYINITKTKEIFLIVFFNMSVSWMWNGRKKMAFQKKTTLICRKLFLMYLQKV